MQNKVVITGAGVISAIGNNKAGCLESLLQERSGVGEVCYLRTTHREFPVGEVKMSNAEMAASMSMEEKGWSRTELMGVIALKEALDDAGLYDCNSGKALSGNMAFISGTTVGGMDVTEECYPDGITADVINHHDCGSTTNRIADFFGCFNLTTTISTACSSATNAFLLGEMLIKSGRKDVVVVGGSESLSRFHLNGFKSLMILDENLCCPFDAQRRGLNLGEGAAYIVLESEQHALQRHATVQAQLMATANRCDAFHQTASSADGEGAFLAMTDALRKAGLQPSDIDYVNAHGTGTPNNDASESAALRRVFGEGLTADGAQIKVSSTKAFTGHTTSASGAIETVFCMLTMQHGFIPANLNFKHADAECIVPVASTLHKDNLRYVMCNGFGFGGNDSTLIIGKYGK